ncbi:MAG: D-cysteine desulfhydrase family protein [Actinomycetia bacterium]|nr:D-cysteine desulfhydrase family protein [Actinomycetes bacterium]MCP3911663.1 D-cysteine desulfhydrase family protein [Actinomycetes bacterium]MCP4086932.1 D-cysteine desulfhydrase family protein [Actinomycetes bacterium]
MTAERVDLGGHDTPCLPADRLGAALGFGPGMLWIKRDDLTRLAGGGNKVRKLEHLVAAALAEGADVLVTGGAAQSNHVRQTAAAAQLTGMDCVGVFSSDPPPVPEGNIIIDRLLGLDERWMGPLGFHEVDAAITQVCDELEAEGRAPYRIPIGGSSPVGALGYVDSADEIDQVAPAGSVVYVAVGSGGTAAGLGVGLGSWDRLMGVDVVGGRSLEGFVARLGSEAAALIHRPDPGGRAGFDRSQVGEGYGTPTEECHAALELAVRTEGIILDPVYSGKAMAALVADRRSGRLPADQPTVFVHTGGLPGLLVDRYQSWFPQP